jgi:plasmid stabilization system protein ParE
MAFRVEVSPEAFGDLDRIASYIQENATAAIAERWFNGIFAAIRTLSAMPSRCSVAEESAELETEVRLLLHGKRKRRYKIYFAIHEETETVRILHVRHWARKPVEADELSDLMDEAVGIENEDDSI